MWSVSQLHPLSFTLLKTSDRWFLNQSTTKNVWISSAQASLSYTCLQPSFTNVCMTVNHRLLNLTLTRNSRGVSPFRTVHVYVAPRLLCVLSWSPGWLPSCLWRSVSSCPLNTTKTKEVRVLRNRKLLVTIESILTHCTSAWSQAIDDSRSMTELTASGLLPPSSAPPDQQLCDTTAGGWNNQWSHVAVPDAVKLRSVSLNWGDSSLLCLTAGI